MNIWLKIFLIILLAFCGSFIQRVTGFGYGIFVMIFLPSILSDYGPATLLSTISSLLATLFVVIKHKKDIQWKVLIPCILGGMVTLYFSVEFMKGVSNKSLKAMLSVILILLSIYFLFAKKEHKIKPHPAKGLFAGGLSGIMGGLFAMSGPPMVVYLLGSMASSAAYIATIQTHFAILGVYTVIVKAAAGFFTKEVMLMTFPSIAGLLAGTFCGEKVSKKLDGKKLKKAVYIFMGISGVVTLLTVIL